jgi:hypothetical protein
MWIFKEIRCIKSDLLSASVVIYDLIGLYRFISQLIITCLNTKR